MIDARSGGAKGAIGCIPLLIAIGAAYLFGVDPAQVLQFFEEAPTSTEAPAPDRVPQDEAGEFVSVILADTEDTWNELFRERNATYREPELVLFSNTVRSACGLSGSATAPSTAPPTAAFTSTSHSSASSSS